MEKILNKYETIFVLDIAAGDEATEATEAKFKTLIEQNGTIDQLDVWGKRRLAYTIDYKNEGYYVLVRFTSEPTFIAELERIYGITESVIRSMVVRVA